MNQGLRSLFESAAPTLILAMAVLIAGIGYGFYERQVNPPHEASAPETAAASASN